jgi:hypothetical protein
VAKIHIIARITQFPWDIQRFRGDSMWNLMTSNLNDALHMSKKTLISYHYSLLFLSLLTKKNKISKSSISSLKIGRITWVNNQLFDKDLSRDNYHLQGETSSVREESLWIAINILLIAYKKRYFIYRAYSSSCYYNRIQTRSD